MSENQEFRELPRLASLDGLRTLAVVLTSLVHLVPEYVPGGFLGVDVFFVLSGFLITSLLLGEFDRSGRIDILRFYIRRARRLLPAVLVLMLVFSVVSLVISASRRDIVVTGVVDAGILTYTANWAPVFGHHPPWQVDHIWSLSVEEQFYLLWPLLLIAGMRWLSRTAILRITAVAALVSMLAQGASFVLWHSTEISYLASPLHAHGILLGSFLGQLYTWRRGERALARLAGWWWPLPAALVVLLALALTTGVDALFTYTGGMALAVGASGVLVFGLAARETVGTGQDLGTRVFGCRPMVAIGKRSYSIYLWQNFLAWALTPWFRDSFWWIPVNVVATLAAAELSYRCVEQRFLRRSRRSAPGRHRAPRSGRPAAARLS
ncbi:acyltransferase family protein [Nakamurella multipartita]|uniref:Acyltransferase 3 n=1 Tax=Nakamurella multipartita (strain ATCC 700099 / DSM 44233 / CIP 104796 / JCM 9543 / NBRC 105858 / Y-104) TaxID=479431 RepID=C8XC09_NAKMY|nr:acyltransferase [Nakamurella multipartita]ACV79513.1 acyltransferase 3 [Nakamurella multipartita DSM 44233]